MEQITNWNNTAVGYLSAGLRFHEAEQLLRKAMACLNEDSRTSPSMEQEQKVPLSTRRSLRESSSSRRSSSASSPNDLSSDMDSSDIDMFGPDMDEDYFEDDDDDIETTVQSVQLNIDPAIGNDHNVLPLYNRGLVVSCELAEREEIAAVILYNMALIKHIHGLHYRSHQAIQTALRLYELAIKILHRNGANSDELLVDELLALSLFYNLGHAHSHLFSDKATCYFGFLRQILRHSSENHGTAALQDEDHSFFFFNAMLFKGEQLTLAPAA